MIEVCQFCFGLLSENTYGNIETSLSLKGRKYDTGNNA